MEEKKKKKQEEKKKKEGAQKKAADQKTKVPEPTKTCSSQPQPAGTSTSTSTSTISSSNNGKRASASGQQPAASRYLPREVPPRFRQQEQKQLLKRGQPLPTGTLTSVSPTQGAGPAGVSPPPLPGAGTQHHPSKLQPDLSHSGLADHYENSHWGQQPTYRSEANCSWDKVIIDRTDKEAWPSITGTETESASECTTDTDSASNCGSENSSMATGSAQGNFTGHTKKTNGNNGTNGALVQSPSNQSALGAGGANSNGSAARVWGVATGSSSGLAHCSISGGDGKMDTMIGDGRSQNCWGASNSNGGINLNLNPNANPAAWPVLGHEGTVATGNPSSICSPVSAIGQNMGNQNGNPTGTLGAWGNLLPQESTEPQTSTSQNVSFSAQPQNLNTDGPNNTNPMNSSPNPINAMQTNGLPNWGMAVGMGAIIPPHLQGLPGANGSSVSQVSGGSAEGISNSVWGLSPGNPATGNSNSGFSQGNGDTVNSALSAKQNGSSSAVQKEGNGGNAWDSGPPAGPGILAWGRGSGNNGVGNIHSGAWGHPSRSTSNSVNGEWGKPPNQHSNSDINGKGSAGWESPGVTIQNPTVQPGGEHMNSWAKAASSGTTASEGSSDGSGNHNEGSTGREGTGEGRRRDKGIIDQGHIQLPRNDLDPRVLSNTGWGQTPVKQNTAWEFEESPRSERKNDNGTEAWGCAATQPSNSGGKNDGSIMNSTNTSSVSGWVNAPPAAVPANTGWGDSNNKAPSGPGVWGDSISSTAVSTAAAAKSGHAWSGAANQEDKSPTWGEPPKPKSQHWGDGQRSNPTWSAGGGDWADSSSVLGHLGDGKKNGSGWDADSNRSGSGWNDTTRSGSSGWGNSTNTKANPGTNWGETLKPGPQQNWASKPQDNNVSNWGGAASVKQTGTGWIGGPVPVKQKDSSEATGWEEPSPPSIRRKMEIDDGTSAWGDPSNYNNKTVNMWDRNNPVIQSSTTTNTTTTTTTTSNTTHRVETPPPHQASTQLNRSPLLGPGRKVSSGWGEMPNVHSKTENSWGEPSSPSALVDNGTAAWGKPPSSGSGWGDHPAEPPVAFGRAGAPVAASALCKPASKSMQEGWGSGGDEMNLSTSQWEDEEGDVWNNAASQESTSSCSSWGNAPKKGLQKGMKTSGKQDEAWIMSRLIKQLTDMGFPREPAEEALKSNNMNLDQAMSALLEKKVDVDKRGLGVTDHNGMAAKPLGCRPPISKESSVDRPTFLDKLTLSFSNQDGGLVEEPTPSPFLPSPSLKLPLSHSALPSQALGGIASGLGMQNLNSSRQIPSGNLGMFGNSGAAQARTMQQPPQPPVQPLNSSQPSLRAQVPQFLSPQVQAQLLQFAAKNIGLNPALLTSPINPQHMTMLNQLYQLQLAYQRLQIQQQMIQAQRNVSGSMRQQEQQVARTITNLQQQIQQHQRQLAQALLVKQPPPPPPPPHLSLHPSAGKSAMDSFPSHPQTPGLPDLQTKEQQSSPNTFAPYSLAGLNPNMNVNSMDMTSGLSVKDPSQSQSRLPQWTHPNSMDNLPSAASPLEQNPSKHGAIPGGLSIGPPGKSSIDDSYGRYDLIQNSESPASPPVAVPHSWSRAKSDSDKISNGSSINWPPEFHPGVPWKGLQNIDPENDPDVTPGSVPTGPTINTTIQDVNRYLLKSGVRVTNPDTATTLLSAVFGSAGSSPPSSQNATLPSSSAWPLSASGYSSSFSSIASAPSVAGKLSDIKSTWSSGPASHTQASLSHELWKVPRNTTAPTRPPPGLTNPKPSSTWGASPLGWTSSYSSGSAWSTDTSGRTSSWLVLRNLTPQIDGSTLRTLCLQHGPLITFHLNLTQGNAVVRYSSKEEAAKAQKSLHMCVLGNTTILAEFAGEEEVNRFLAQGQALPPTSSWQSSSASSQPRLSAASSSHGLVRSDAGHWNAPCLGGKGSSELLWGGVPQYSSSLWGPPSADDSRVIGSPTPLTTLLPGDLLSGESL
ncbi:trinucleotide repeat-containing gene 6C protein isoform X8 [Hylobates moloch]|uniref:trinucleotide repeat-containing gene 6C protein isoform X8 n=1 Tax=Hylobates moloch TaxID=81572 RepID=UPI001364031A|nr:trinucleotide repeat-containing gene 6C protein isoform X8 [Hylobates moloch]XP_058284968.1 trinucleotide repeat-containing gene 6C protein isoform X8 [Hylobates moloch]